MSKNNSSAAGAAPLTPNQLRALIAARDHGTAYADMQGSGNGGRARTVNVLKERGLLDWQSRITLAGRTVLVKAQP